MIYSKPQIVRMDKAVQIILGTAKNSNQRQDGPNGNWTATIGAYESDE